MNSHTIVRNPRTDWVKSKRGFLLSTARRRAESDFAQIPLFFCLDAIICESAEPVKPMLTLLFFGGFLRSAVCHRDTCPVIFTTKYKKFFNFKRFYLMTPDTFEVLSMTHSGRRRNIGTLIAAATIAFFFTLEAVPRFVGSARTNITRPTLLTFPLGSHLSIHHRRCFLAVVRLLVRQLVSTHTYLWCGHCSERCYFTTKYKKFFNFYKKKELYSAFFFVLFTLIYFWKIPHNGLLMKQQHAHLVKSIPRQLCTFRQSCVSIFYKFI